MKNLSSDVVHALNEQYYMMRLAGYRVEDLWCIIFDHYVFLCDEDRLISMTKDCPSELVVKEMEEFRGIESREGLLRLMNNQKDYVEMGWVRPSNEIEVVIGNGLGQIVMMKGGDC